MKQSLEQITDMPNLWSWTELLEKSVSGTEELNAKEEKLNDKNHSENWALFCENIAHRTELCQGKKNVLQSN